MRISELPKWRLLAIAALCVLSVSGYAARDDEDDDEMDEVTAEELQIEDIPVDERIFITEWNKVPYDARYFTYSDEQIKEKWDYLMRGLRIPYPSAAFMKKQFKKYPFLADDIEGFTAPLSDADFVRLEKVYLGIWRKFFAGDFQEARKEGLAAGPLGVIPALFSQLMYAIYLTDRQTVKYMLLQDVANTAKDYFKLMEPAEQDPEAQAVAAAARLGYAYAIARIAEESPVPIVVARRYIGKIKGNSEFITEIMPNHPLGHAFRAGVDAGIMRRVGKFTGRMTYGARTTTVEDSFAKALELAPDIPIVSYEYGNALIYMNRKRNLNKAMKSLESATKMRPQFSMDALDTMYAYKRLQEVKLYALNYSSFRKFEKARRKFSKATDRNLTSVLTPSLTMDMLENPDKYILED
tara:strand:- start:106890 stop:108119 length:1230 start_codon:yes stop_codon:yes gene_type:complete